LFSKIDEESGVPPGDSSPGKESGVPPKTEPGFPPVMEPFEGAAVQFRRLYESVFPVLFRIAYHIAVSEEAAEDLCQEAFFRLHEKKMVFPSTDEAKYWLIRVVKNAALNYAKRKERERRAYQRAFREDVRVAETGEDALLKKESRGEVREALKKLPLNLRMVLILKEYGELNYKEIGRTLGISEGNVKVRVFRARERLLGLLEAGVSFRKDGSSVS
jgi:RNA polymerase sigma-70 factor (ECF subfamily)